MSIFIDSLYIYPVKSLRGIHLSESPILSTGLKHDREWMIVDDKHHFVTQRQFPQMARIAVEITDLHLTLSHPEMQEKLKIDIQKGKTGKKSDVFIWADKCPAIDEGEEASRWLQQALPNAGKLRLVRFDKKHQRTVDPHYLRPQEQSGSAFSDGFPFLICSIESLQKLNSHLENKGEKTVAIQRFRPNIVIRGAKPFAEDQISQLLHSNFSLALRKPCQRCRVITINQSDASIPNPKEPLSTLIEINNQPELKGAYFGQNAILTSSEEAVISSGMKLTPL